MLVRLEQHSNDLSSTLSSFYDFAVFDLSDFLHNFPQKTQHFITFNRNSTRS